MLSEAVAERMRACGFLCKSVQIHIRDKDLQSYERQGPLGIPSCTAKDIFDKAFALYRENRPEKPVRSLGVRACALMVQEVRQLSLFEDEAKCQQQEQLERTVDRLRERFGHFSLRRGIMLADPALAALDPVADHVIHPEAFLKGA